AVVHHGLGEVEAFGLDRLDRMLGDAADLADEFLALVGERGEQAARFLVDDARHFGGALPHRRRNLLGLADEIARHLGADRKQRAFHLAGILLEHVAHAGRHAADHALGVVRARADRGRGAGRELGQRTLGLGAVGLDRLAALLEAAAERLPSERSASLVLALIALVSCSVRASIASMEPVVSFSIACAASPVLALIVLLRCSVRAVSSSAADWLRASISLVKLSV